MPDRLVLNMNIKIVIPDRAQYVLKKLDENGYDGYMVGGCIRDSILKRVPGDWDIATNALPSDVINIFGGENAIPTGIKYGTVTVIVDGEPFEVTTYRIDTGYSDFRRPDKIKFTSSIKEELGRRDFTVNAMAYNDKSGLIDLFGGLDDINRKLIRCVGSPDERFSEDALRMVRAARFAAQLGFEIDGATIDSINRNRGLLERISSERIMAELNKTLTGDFPHKIQLMFSSGLMEYIIPQAYSLYKGPDGDERLHRTIEVFANTMPHIPVRMAALLYCLGIKLREESHSILRKLRYDNSTINITGCLIENLEENMEDDERYIRRMLYKMGRENLEYLINIKMALSIADGSKEYRCRIESAMAMMDDIVARGECYSIKDLRVNGRDLTNAGFSGREVGNILVYLLDAVIDDPGLNYREKLMQMAEHYNKSQDIEGLPG